MPEDASANSAPVLIRTLEFPTPGTDRPAVHAVLWDILSSPRTDILSDGA